MKKPTLATLKSFIKREHKNGNLYIKQTSTFDGMVDCNMPVKEDYRKVEGIDMENKNTLGIRGLWLAGSSRDYITPYADDNFIGYEVDNCANSAIIAMKRLC